MTSRASAPAARMWSSSPGSGTGAEPRSVTGPERARGPEPSRGPSPAPSGSARERVEDEVGPGQIAGRRRLVAPLDDGVRADDDERALGEATLVVDAEGTAGRALGLEVRQLLDRHPQLLLERRLGVGGVARDA